MAGYSSAGGPGFLQESQRVSGLPILLLLALLLPHACLSQKDAMEVRKVYCGYLPGLRLKRVYLPLACAASYVPQAVHQAEEQGALSGQALGRAYDVPGEQPSPVCLWPAAVWVRPANQLRNSQRQDRWVLKNLKWS